jgi:hypothetical protein
MNVVKIMEEYGFTSISTGGGCKAYSKDIKCRGKAAYILVVNDGGLDLPKSLKETVYAGIYDFDTGDPIVEAEPFDNLKGYLDTLNELESDKFRQ